MGHGSHFSIMYGEWVMVTPDFFVAKPVRQYRSACVAFPTWTWTTHVFRLLRGKQAVMIRCSDHAKKKEKSTITLPYMTVKMVATPIALHSGQRETWFLLLNSFVYLLLQFLRPAVAFCIHIFICSNSFWCQSSSLFCSMVPFYSVEYFYHNGVELIL